MYRIAGAFLIIVGFSLTGRAKVTADRRNIRLIHEFIKAINMMICELEFHRTPFPTLCAFVSERTVGVISCYFSGLEKEVSSQAAPDIRTCSNAVLGNIRDIPASIKSLLHLTGESLGCFGVEGQVDQLRYVKSAAENTLDNAKKRFEIFGRTYQILWICAGIALVVILI